MFSKRESLGGGGGIQRYHTDVGSLLSASTSRKKKFPSSRSSSTSLNLTPTPAPAFASFSGMLNIAGGQCFRWRDTAISSTLGAPRDAPRVGGGPLVKARVEQEGEAVGKSVDEVCGTCFSLDGEELVGEFEDDEGGEEGEDGGDVGSWLEDVGGEVKGFELRGEAVGDLSNGEEAGGKIIIGGRSGGQRADERVEMREASGSEGAREELAIVEDELAEV